MQVSSSFAFEGVIESITQLNWQLLGPDDMTDIAMIYYYFSIQFRESLRVARDLYPGDEKLAELEHAECHTDNLSPWPGVALAGERIDHDEFLRRTLALSPIADRRRSELDAIGLAYLKNIRMVQRYVRAQSIASYEDGGLERVFTAILTCKTWNSPLLRAFRHFLLEHIRFDADAEQGHGALARHLKPSDGILPIWTEFKRILVEAVPALEA